jgi:glycerophosphoryl diester phosphodiesterase
MLVFGHRGAAGHEPENTLRSIRKAIELGTHWIEIDVYAVEGELVVIHDETLERTTNGTGRVVEQSLSHLRSLDAGGGEQIPLLSEVLDVIAGCAGLNVELKGDDTELLVAAALNECIQHGWSPRQLMVSAASLAHLVLLREAAPQLSLGQVIEDNLERGLAAAAELGLFSVHPAHEAVESTAVRQAHALGMRVFPYTVNEYVDIQRMRQLAVDGVFSDFPDRVLAQGADPVS